MLTIGRCMSGIRQGSMCHLRPHDMCLDVGFIQAWTSKQTQTDTNRFILIHLPGGWVEGWSGGGVDGSYSDKNSSVLDIS